MTPMPRPELKLAPAPTDQPKTRPPMWELAECNCPDFCERDHERD